jgi:hypothetical protein
MTEVLPSFYLSNKHLDTAFYSEEVRQFVLKCLNLDDELMEQLLMWPIHIGASFSPKLIASKMPVYRSIQSLHGSPTIPDDFRPLMWTALVEEVE